MLSSCERVAWRVKNKILLDTPEEYPIYPDDELQLDYSLSSRDFVGGVYTKVGPGLAIVGIELRDDEVEEYIENRRWTF